MSACSGGGAASGMDGKTVKMFTWVGSPDEKAQWQAYVDGAKLVDPQVKVSFSGPAIGNYYTKLPTQLKGSDAPCIVTLQNGQVAPFASALEPLDSLAKDAGVTFSDYNASMISQLSASGKVYALPYDAEPFVVFYNKKYFAQAGVADPAPDWTTKDFVAAAKATTRGGVYGFAIGQGIGAVGNFMATNGESYVSKDGKADLSNKDLVARFQWLVDLATKDKVSKPLEASGGTFPDIDQFSNGQAAMFINGTWDLLHEQQALGKDNVGIATIPADNGKPKGSIAGTGFGITKTCGDKKAAFTAISAMTSEKSQESVAKSRSQVPARADALDAWKSSVGAHAASVVGTLQANGQVLPGATQSTQIGTLFTQYEVDAFSGKSTVQEVLRQVAAGVTQ
jgi:multiple sugar transport system substrate-binding protein